MVEVVSGIVAHASMTRRDGTLSGTVNAMISGTSSGPWPWPWASAACAASVA